MGAPRGTPPGRGRWRGRRPGRPLGASGPGGTPGAPCLGRRGWVRCPGCGSWTLAACGARTSLRDAVSENRMPRCLVSCDWCAVISHSGRWHTGIDCSPIYLSGVFFLQYISYKLKKRPLRLLQKDALNCTNFGTPIPFIPTKLWNIRIVLQLFSYILLHFLL